LPKNKPHYRSTRDNADLKLKIIESVQISVICVISGKVLAFWGQGHRQTPGSDYLQLGGAAHE
jgi:hypothetical protein